MSISRGEGLKPEEEESLDNLACSVMPNGSSKPGVPLQRDLYIFVSGARLQFPRFAIDTLTLKGSVIMTLAKVVLSFAEHPLKAWINE